MRPRFGAAASAALLFGAAAAGASSDAEMERTRFSIHPSVQVTAVADDNIRLLEDDRDGDLGAFISPRVELGYQSSWFDLGADLGADIRRYVNDDAPNKEFLRLRGFGEFGLLPGLTIRVSDVYAPTPVELGLPEDQASNLKQTNRLTASLRYWHELPAGPEFVFSLQGTRLTSESFSTFLGNGVVDHDFHADYWEGAFQGEFQSPLVERTSTFLRTEVRYRSFDDSAASDQGDLTVLVGIRSHWFRNFDFDVAAGYGLIAFDTGGNVNRFLGRANLRYRMSGGMTWRLSVASTSAADIVGNDYTETTGRIGVEKRFGERTALSIDCFLSRFDNEIWDAGADVFGGVEARLRRQLTRRTQLALAYRYWKNGGQHEVDDFHQNLASLVFTFRY